MDEDDCVGQISAIINRTEVIFRVVLLLDSLVKVYVFSKID